MFFNLNGIVFANAYSAGSSSIRNPGVFFIEFMPADAFSFSSIFCSWSNSTQDIFPIGDRLQMIGTNAVFHSAEVVKNIPFWDLPIRLLVGKSMGYNAFPVKIKKAISLLVFIGGPKPAQFRLLNLFPKSFRRGAVGLHPISHSPCALIFAAALETAKGSIIPFIKRARMALAAFFWHSATYHLKWEREAL